MCTSRDTLGTQIVVCGVIFYVLGCLLWFDAGLMTYGSLVVWVGVLTRHGPLSLMTGIIRQQMLWITTGCLFALLLTFLRMSVLGLLVYLVVVVAYAMRNPIRFLSMLYKNVSYLPIVRSHSE